MYFKYKYYNRVIMSKYKITNIIIDSNYRDKASYPLANNFVVYFGDTLKNVIALRIVKTEFIQPSNANSYFVINSIPIPLQLQTGTSAYLYLNNYDKYAVCDGTTTTNANTNTFFTRIVPGTEIYPSMAVSNSFHDPFVYLFNPPNPKLNRFHVKLLNHDRSLFPLQDATSTIILTLAIYCENDLLQIQEERHKNTIPPNFREFRGDALLTLERNEEQLIHERERRKNKDFRGDALLALARGDEQIVRERKSEPSKKADVVKLNQWFDNFIIESSKKTKSKR